MLFLALLFWLLLTASSLLGDPDSQWHVAIGRWIWTHGAVPRTDLFSHTFAGAPWIAKEWLSQLILFAAYQLDGWRGVAVLAALAIAASFTLLFGWLRARLHPTAALAIVLVAIVLAQPHFLARPHMLVLPIIVLWVMRLVAALERGVAPSPALALLMVPWVNMHGSFPLGLVIAGALGGEGVWRTLSAARHCERGEATQGPRVYAWVASPSARNDGHRSDVRALRGWALFLVATLAATLVSPFGWDAVLVPLRMSGNADTLAYVGEWHPLRLDAMGIIALAVLAATVVLLTRELERNVFRLIAVALLAYLMVRHARFISLFAVVTPILSAGAAARWRAFAPKPGPAGATSPWPIALALALAVLVAICLIRPEPAADVTPEAAYRAALAHGMSGPVYNDYDFGGYLIAHDVRTFVDGRTDQLFLGGFLPALAHAITSKDDTDFAALMKRYNVTWALVRAGSRDAGHLASIPGWTKIHQDPVAAVFVAGR